MSIGTVITPVDPASGLNAVDHAVDRAGQAAQAGVASVWFAQRFDVDAVALGGIVGRAVPGISVGTSVVPIFGRHPLLLAGQAQTAQAATGGRYTLGIGLGAKPFVEPVYGVPFERPIARLRDFITALRSVFEHGGVDFQGETLIAKNPVPAAVAGSGPVSIVVAAMGPQALRVTGELADGTLPYLAGPKALSGHIVPAITTAAERAGRPAPRIVALLPAVVTDQVDQAREKAAAETAFYDKIPSYQRSIELSGVTRAAELVTIGDERAVSAEIRRYLDAGATEVVLAQTDLVGPADQLRTWQLAGSLN